MTWLQRQKTGRTSWTKTFRLQSQIEVAVFAAFRQEKSWMQNRILTAFLVTVSWLMRHWAS